MKNRYLEFDEDKKKLYKNTKIYKAIVVLCMCSVLGASLYFGVFKCVFEKVIDIIPEEVPSYIPNSNSAQHSHSDGDSIKLYDTVEYRNLTPGKTYTVTGVLYNKDTGEQIMTASQQFVADSDGKVTVEYDLDKEKVAGKTLVATEKLDN